MTSTTKLGWPPTLKADDFWLSNNKQDLSQRPANDLPLPWSGEMVDLRKKNAAKRKALAAQEAVDLPVQIESAEDSDDKAAYEVSQLPNNVNTAPQFIPMDTLKDFCNQANKSKPKKTSARTNSEAPDNPFSVPK